MHDVPRVMNEEGDTLAKLATQGPTSDSIPVIMVHNPSIQEGL